MQYTLFWYETPLPDRTQFALIISPAAPDAVGHQGMSNVGGIVGGVTATATAVAIVVGVVVFVKRRKERRKGLYFLKINNCY